MFSLPSANSASTLTRKCVDAFFQSHRGLSQEHWASDCQILSKVPGVNSACTQNVCDFFHNPPRARLTRWCLWNHRLARDAWQVVLCCSTAFEASSLRKLVLLWILRQTLGATLPSQLLWLVRETALHVRHIVFCILVPFSSVVDTRRPSTSRSHSTNLNGKEQGWVPLALCMVHRCQSLVVPSSAKVMLRVAWCRPLVVALPCLFRKNTTLEDEGDTMGCPTCHAHQHLNLRNRWQPQLCCSYPNETGTSTTL